jgi:hypothetical protein
VIVSAIGTAKQCSSPSRSPAAGAFASTVFDWHGPVRCGQTGDVTVVRLGAWCDLDDDAVELDAAQRSASFRVREFAELDDGRRLVLTDESQGKRGFTSVTSTYGGGSPVRLDQWVGSTAGSIESTVRTTVLPDDDGGDEHPWGWLADRLTELGVPATPDDLRGLPYDVELSPRLLARLSAGRPVRG